MLKSPQEGQCNMKIEDESLCDSFNCQKDQISAENGWCMKLMT